MKILSILIIIDFVFALQLMANNKSKKAPSAKELKIELSSKGNDIAFDIKSFQVTHGKSFILKFQNSAHKDSEIIHNIAILKPGSTEKVLQYFEKTDYDIEKVSKHDSVIAITPPLEPGQTGSLELKKEMIPKPGFYPYICLIPGHADMLGMKGIMHVK